MSLEEVLDKIKETEEEVKELETAYEVEEDGHKAELLWRKIEKKGVELDRYITKADKLREEKPPEPKDEDVCPMCGGDLVFVGEDEDEVDVYQCEKCHEMYLDE